MKLVAVFAFFAAICLLTATAEEEAAIVEEESGGEEQTEDQLEEELGAIDISETIVHLPTIPQEIEGGPAWECAPRMIYRNSCQVCKCTRQRRLRCVRRNCNPL